MIQLIRCITWSTTLATSGSSRYKDDQVRVVGLSLLEDHKIIAQIDSSICWKRQLLYQRPDDHKHTRRVQGTMEKVSSNICLSSALGIGASTN
jgi:hypothetical protein